MSLNTRQHRENLNVLVIGGSGSGKSRFYVKPNIMQLNTSYVVTDPKGELLRSCGRLLKKAGYEIRVFNLIDMSHSNNYNPFNYVYDRDGNVNKSYVLKMINCLMKNTKKRVHLAATSSGTMLHRRCCLQYRSIFLKRQSRRTEISAWS